MFCLRRVSVSAVFSINLSMLNAYCKRDNITKDCHYKYYEFYIYILHIYYICSLISNIVNII